MIAANHQRSLTHKNSTPNKGNMKKIGLTFAVVVTMGSAISLAHALSATASSELGRVAVGFSLVEQTQFTYGEHDYCWYDDGWNGPGWYWCGYGSRQGFGFGGRSGWQHHPHQPPGITGKPGTGFGTSPVHGSGSSHNPTSPPKCTTLACRKHLHISPSAGSRAGPPAAGANGGKPVTKK
jgi:hypothetical protein